ncbi:hypothetical protein ACHAWC_004868 [Mediolabrus comicus]
MSEDVKSSRTRTSTTTVEIAADRSSDVGSFANEDPGSSSSKSKCPELVTEESTRTRPNVPRGYSASHKVVEDGTTKTHIKRMWQKLTVGGTVFDGFLLAASQEVGQAILALPMAFAQLGFASGIVFEFFFATLALYTCVLLVQMHAQFRHDLKVTEDPRHFDEYYIASYHEIMDHFVGKWLKYFSMAVVWFNLISLSTVQIIASASNLYLISDSVNKRTWAIIIGCVFTPIAFVPTFRHYRMLSIFGILTTTYISWYMTITAAVQGPSENTTYSAPSSFEQFMLGIVALLFTYGGHTSNIEVADVMNNPASYDRSYFWSYLYVFTLTMPNAVAAYHTFGDLCLYNSNAIALYPKTPARDIGLVFMVVHEAVAFGLFAGPLFHMWEKFLHIHNRPFVFRAVCRVPVCGFMLFLAVAFPFFGAINAVIGAFGTSFGENLIKQCYFSFKAVRLINWLIVIVVGFLGVGYGGYTSIKSFIAQINEYEVFAECYQCDIDGKLHMPPGVDADDVSEEG